MIFIWLFTGSGWQQSKKNGDAQNDSSNPMRRVSVDELPTLKFHMQTQFIPNESFNYTSSTHRILKDNNYNYREEKVSGTNYTHSLTTKLFPLHDGLVDDPIKNIRTPARLYEKKVRNNHGHGNFVKSSSSLRDSLPISSSRFLNIFTATNVKLSHILSYI